MAIFGVAGQGVVTPPPGAYSDGIPPTTRRSAGPAQIGGPEVDQIERLQPDRGVDLSNDPEGAARAPLATLTQVSDADEHAAPHGAVACLAPTSRHGVVSIEPKVPVGILWTRRPLTRLKTGWSRRGTGSEVASREAAAEPG